MVFQGFDLDLISVNRYLLEFCGVNFFRNDQKNHAIVIKKISWSKENTVEFAFRANLHQPLNM